MARVAARVTDKRVLKLIRAFLNSGGSATKTGIRANAALWDAYQFLSRSALSCVYFTVWHCFGRVRSVNLLHPAGPKFRFEE
jgi:hypothetical protein